MVERFPSVWFPDGPPPTDHGPAGRLPPRDDRPRSDDALLVQLQRDLDGTAFQDILVALDGELERRLRSISQELWGWPGIRHDTQAVLSLAAAFGFTTLATLARAVSAGDRPPCLPAEVFQPFLAELRRLRSITAALNRKADTMDGSRTVAAPDNGSVVRQRLRGMRKHRFRMAFHPSGPFVPVPSNDNAERFEP